MTERLPWEEDRAWVLAQPCVRMQTVGHTLLGRPIERYSVGEGRRRLLYVGAHHGTEWLTASMLFCFLRELIGDLGTGRVRHGVHVRTLLAHTTLDVLPLLNADGCALVLTDAPSGPLSVRQVRMSGGQGFLRWQANARGVDLNHNYDHGHRAYKQLEARQGIEAGASLYSGEYPESEPECAALASLVRASAPAAVLSLHLGEDGVYAAPRTSEIACRTALRIGALSGTRPLTPKGTACYGGLCDYTGEVLSIPSFTLSVGQGENPPPKEALGVLYERVAPVLLRLPTML